MKIFVKSLVLILLANISLAQTPIEVSGILKDSTGLTVISAAIKLYSRQDTLSAVSDVDGKFTIRNVKNKNFTLNITALGFKPFAKAYNYSSSNTNTIHLGSITLSSDVRLLSQVTVDGTPDVVVKEDTLQFRADQYKLKDNALAEDLLKKLPGVEVDRDGNVTTQGKQVTRVRVNGKDFFGGDVKTATQNLPADVLQNVQIIDDYGDQANITGVKDGEPEKILNFTIRPDRNKGYLTRGTVGVGDKERYQASVFAAKFNNNQQISVLANLNNTNANIFNLTQQGGGRRGGRSGGGNFNSSSGLTDVKSFGLNYRDQWSEKVTAYGSYSIFGRNNAVESTTLQENLATANNNFTTVDNNKEVNSKTENINHRFDFNIEYKIDTLNYLKFTPRVTFSTTDKTENSNFNILRNDVLSSEGNYVDITDSRTPNLGADFLFNHRFAGTTRNLSLSAYLNTSSSNSGQDYLNKSLEYNDPISAATSLYQRQLIDNDNSTNNININTSYIEPLSKTKSLEFNYEYGFNKIDNNRTVMNTDVETDAPIYDPNLSNNYNFSFTTNRFGLNYRAREEKYNYTLGLGLQPSVLKGESITRNTSTRTTALNIYPSARFQYKFSRSKEFNINYNGRSNLPSYNQLQPVTDNSNPQFPVVGNPNLGAEFNNSVNIRYNNSNITTGNTFFTNFNFNLTKDKIVSTTNTPSAGSATNAIQERGYTNANGYYSLNGFYAYNRQLKDKKYVFGLRGMANYNNNISFINNEKNIGRNLVLSQRLQIQIQPKEWLEIVPSINYTYNTNDNTISKNANRQVHTWATAFDSKIYFTKTFLWGTQADKSFNRGYGSIGANPFIINTYLEKQFFKGNTGALRLTAFDLLDESTAISRTVDPAYILDSRSNRLSRYFMLTFSMRINKFAGNSSMGGENRERYRGGDRGPGGYGGGPGF
ncbi:hypothetical protein Pedsa_2971 [Pseudopedobacter saltans DSM 12145]|uniref:Outer membrane protein beta-barrel domain-containing protein n=1 Tax=Pseudopedobacter saltans (strain ATCC 51119 / DSM 12145 / JCM 21818 / CCUG 39354 / LMG 10337 / NBRC 100064 / NCIMB 13643) TaxID=762903 RepID=F0S9F7_PSESL|nr:outer membrane beta-barrel protein [Pseudopedobacter saltans]ADY53510.1 hypothetical protein Pedsa_2971 [Pseudopedobacter saltans DSM 12145]